MKLHIFTKLGIMNRSIEVGFFVYLKNLKKLSILRDIGKKFQCYLRLRLTEVTAKEVLVVFI